MIFTVEYFSQSASGKNIAGVGHDTLVSAGFFWSYLCPLRLRWINVFRTIYVDIWREGAMTCAVGLWVRSPRGFL